MPGYKRRAVSYSAPLHRIRRYAHPTNRQQRLFDTTAQAGGHGQDILISNSDTHRPLSPSVPSEVGGSPRRDFARGRLLPTPTHPGGGGGEGGGGSAASACQWPRGFAALPPSCWPGRSAVNLNQLVLVTAPLSPTRALSLLHRHCQSRCGKRWMANIRTPKATVPVTRGCI